MFSLCLCPFALTVPSSLLFPQTSELGVTEHIEGDPCKFAVWAGRTPSSDNKTVLKVCEIKCKRKSGLSAFISCDIKTVTSPGIQYGS